MTDVPTLVPLFIYHEAYHIAPETLIVLKDSKPCVNPKWEIRVRYQIIEEPYITADNIMLLPGSWSQYGSDKCTAVMYERAR